LLNALRASGYWTLIEPYAGGSCNAFANPKAWVASGRKFRSQITFTPAANNAAGQCSNPTVAGPLGSRDLLHHELVHSLRQTTNQWIKLGLTLGLNGYQDYEEFYAVVATNVLATTGAAKGQAKSFVRGDYGSQPLDYDYYGDFGFYTSSPITFTTIDRYTQSLAKINAAFNPFAGYYSDPVKPEKLSLSEETERRAKQFEELRMWRLPYEIKQMDEAGKRLREGLLNRMGGGDPRLKKAD
jgi:hypothetical protein